MLLTTSSVNRMPIRHPVTVLLTTLSLMAGGCATTGPAHREGRLLLPLAAQRQAYAHYTRGLLNERHARLSEAIKEYRQAVDFDKNSPQIHTRLGAGYMKLGDSEHAVQELTRALELDPRSVQARQALALLYMTQGQFAKAAAEHERVLKEAPDNEDSTGALADLYVLALQHESLDHGHALAVLEGMSVGQGGVRRSLEELARRGWARQLQPGQWALTPEGRVEAERQAGSR